jgi:2-succinyl-6-hydroxy-2,4-cyclohexadiene-1-carboxylate synthase
VNESLPLAADRRGAGRRIVLVHGFTQTRGSWDRFRTTLDDRFETVAVDAPGHGDSATRALDLPAGADALASSGGPATYLGYSMGGRLALHLAVQHPETVRRLVLVSATAGIDDDTERAARREADDRLAEEIETIGVPAFLERWLALPLFATLPADATGVDDRLRNTPAGLASSLRLAGTGTQRPLWDQLPHLGMPVLVVAGELDVKFSALAERIAHLVPGAEVAIVPGAGHTVHLERPDEFAELVGRWLDR